MNLIEIDVYSDFVCPWCFIGWRRLQATLESFGHMDVVTRHHPYLLYPDVSAEGIDLRASLSQRYRQSPDRLFEPAEAAGRVAGIPLDFSKVARMYSTVDAHTLARHAQAKGTASAFAEGIFAAYFLEGRNISRSRRVGRQRSVRLRANRKRCFRSRRGAGHQMKFI